MPDPKSTQAASDSPRDTAEGPLPSQVLLVPTDVLLLIAALVWLVAGASVTSVGVAAAAGAWNSLMAVGTGLTFAFFIWLFIRISKQNVKRIAGLPRPFSFVLGFFDANSYMVMAVMMFLGAALRISTLLPDQVIASFYSGLGAALALASFYSIIRYILAWQGSHFDS